LHDELGAVVGRVAWPIILPVSCIVASRTAALWDGLGTGETGREGHGRPTRSDHDVPAAAYVTSHSSSQADRHIHTRVF